MSREEVVFLVKLCEICHRKTNTKSKGPLVPIISIKLFERVQIDLIDMRSTPDITTTVIFKQIAHLVCCMSKRRILLVLRNKKAVTVATAVNQWICIYGAIDILQSDSGFEFKEVCLELVKSFGVRVINSRPRTPRTQGLVEQANGTVKTRINVWKRTHGFSQWSESLDVSYSIYDSTLM